VLEKRPMFIFEFLPETVEQFQSKESVNGN
jgi:hypothetical protein